MRSLKIKQEEQFKYEVCGSVCCAGEGYGKVGWDVVVVLGE